MGNPLIEGPIPLGGVGFVAKENGNFLPGEYKRLSNLEVDASGVLINRRNVYSVHGESTGVEIDPISNPQRFLGNMGSYSLMTDGENQWAVGASTFLPLWTITDGSGPAGVSSFSTFLGFFRYNNMNFWLVFEFDSAVSVSLVLYHDDGIPVPDIPETYAAGYEADLTRVVILSFAADTTDFYEFQYKNFFIYKERLWIATSVGLYFSASTDPTDFVVPNGGFFKHPGNLVNYAMAIKDQIYTLCDDAVYALTYNTDPNLDSIERPLSDTIGGEMGCVHLDTPYFINNLGIFVINGNNVDKVMDSRFDYGRDTYRNHLYSFEEYLIVQKYNPINYDNNYSPPATVTTRRNLIHRPESDAVGGEQIIDGWVAEGSDSLTLRENLQNNPNVTTDPAAANLDYFKSTSGTDWEIGQSTDEYYLEPASGYVARTGSDGAIDITMNTFWYSVGVGETYTVSVYVNPTGLTTRPVKLKISFSGADTVAFDSEETTIDADVSTWTRIRKTVTTPPGTVFLKWELTYEHCSSTGEQYWDAALLEKTSTLQSYFDGDFVDDTFRTYSWNGTPHDSKSILAVETCLMDPVTAVDDTISTGKVLRFGGTFVDPDELEGNNPDIYGQVTKTFNPTTAFVSGIPYVFRFDYKGNGSWATGRLDIDLEYLSAADAVLGTAHFSVANFAPSPSYATFFRNTIVFPAGTEKMKVTFKFTTDITDAVGSTAWSMDFNKFLLEKHSTFSGYFTGATTDTDDVTYSWVGTEFESESTTGSATTHSYLRNNGSKFEPFAEGNSLGYNTYFINTDNGSVHVLDFMDQYIGFGRGQAGFIVDMIVNPNSDASGNGKIYFFTNKHISEDESGLNYESYPYFISTSEDMSVYDYVVNDSGVLIRRAPKIDVEIDSFVPDGHEYRFKKFRSLMLMGILPSSGMELEVAYDNNAVSQTTELGDNVFLFDSPRSHYAHRIGLNQRGRSITLRLLNPDWLDEIEGNYGNLEVSDMRVLWTYTQRHTTTKHIGS